MVLTLEPLEAKLLRELPGQLRELIADPDPDDPAIGRLFPAAVTGDEDADAEVRQLIFDDLLRERLDALDEVRAVLETGATTRGGGLQVELTGEQPHLVLCVLNDIRLTLGSRVGIEQLDRDEVDRDHPIAPTLALIDHLAWVQELLLRAVDPPSATGGTV